MPDVLITEGEHSAEELERGRWLFAQECQFFHGTHSIDQLPDGASPEIAFAGRSNVGKSSLVNALTGRKTLARTSNTPGRTQQLNFFDLGGKLTLVDLPGYGYAKVSKSKIKVWTDTLKLFLRGRIELRRVCLLIDSRRGIGDGDLEIMRMLDDAAVSYQIVLTKVDKAKVSELSALITKITVLLKKHAAAHPEILTTSAQQGIGISELRAILAGFAEWDAVR